MKAPRWFVILVLLVNTPFALAGVYGDKLGQKLVSSTTPEEKAICVRWMFVAMALHPDLKEMSSITPEQRDKANKDFADLIVRMLTVTCVEETKEAVRYEGAVAIQSAFQLFGQIAGRELLTNAEVARGLAGLEKYADLKALEKALMESGAIPPAEKK